MTARGATAAATKVLGLIIAGLAAAACGPQSSQPVDSASVVLDQGRAAPLEPRATEPARPSATPSASVLHPGDSGTDVQDLQRRLLSLGYWLGDPDGVYGHLTEQAVVALQKAAGLSADGVFGQQTKVALVSEVRPQPRRIVGSGVEVDLQRQLLMHVRAGVPHLIVNASTGSGTTYRQAGIDQVAVTPAGKHTVYREVDGRDIGPLGDLWRPKYIVAGVAIHGYPTVPAFPASHGCVRVSMAAMDHLWSSDALPLGGSVWVY